MAEFDRRTVLRGAVWTAPVIAFAGAAPHAAASGGTLSPLSLRASWDRDFDLITEIDASDGGDLVAIDGTALGSATAFVRTFNNNTAFVDTVLVSFDANGLDGAEWQYDGRGYDQNHALSVLSLEPTVLTRFRVYGGDYAGCQVVITLPMPAGTGYDTTVTITVSAEGVPMASLPLRVFRSVSD